MSVKSLINDPDFQKLSAEDQKVAVSALDPDIGKLNPQDFSTFVGGLRQATEVKPQAQAPAEPQTLAGKALGLVKDVGSYPLSFPANPFRIGNALSSGNVQQSYHALMPQLEKGADVVSGAFNKSIDSGKFPILNDINIPLLGKQNPAKLFSSTIFPFRPSMMMAAAGGAVGKNFGPLLHSGFENQIIPPGGMATAGGFSPLLRSPTIAENNIAGMAGKLGQEGLTSEAAGQGMQAAYDQRVGAPLRELTASQTPTIVPKTGPEIFNPAYESVSKQISPEPVPLSKAGETINTAYQGKVKTLLSNEKKAWDIVSTEHSDKPAMLENTKKYIESISGPQENITALDRLPPGAKEAALKTPNPEETAKAMLQYGQNQGSRAFMGEAPNGGTTPEVQNAQLQRGYGALTKLNEIAQEPTTFGRLKTLRSQLGGMIDWNKRGDTLNHQLKGAYFSLGEDAQGSAKLGGFENEFSAANQSTKDFYNYVEQPSSKIIDKANYPSDLPNRLIKTNSPERVQELFSQHNLSESDKGVVRRGILDEINRQSGGDPKKFSARLDDFSLETKQALFGKQTPLVDSLKDTVKTLNDEISKSKQKPTIYKSEDILSQEGQRLDKLMKTSRASELVSNLLKDGTPEMARTVSSAVGPDGMQIVRRAAINEILNPSKIPLSGEVKSENLAKGLKNLDPQFINEFFGKDAPTVQAIKDSSNFLSDKKAALRADAQGLPFMLRQKAMIMNLFKKYRLSSELGSQLEKQYGPVLSDSIVPKNKYSIPSISGPAITGARILSNENK